MKDRQTTIVSISTNERHVEFSLTGATVTVPAISSDRFRCIVPWDKFEVLLAEKREDIDLVEIGCAKSILHYHGITVHSAEIEFKLLGKGAPQTRKMLRLRNDDSSTDESPASTDCSEVQEPIDYITDAPLGLPLLGAYAYIKKHGKQLNVVNKSFVEQQQRVDNLLEDIRRRCKPLGIGRDDLEKIIDEKIGIRT